MAVLFVTLVAGLLVAAESQASDARNPKGFLSNYNQFITPNTNQMKLGKGPDALYGTANIGDHKEERKAAQTMLAGNNDTPISLYTIGVAMLAFVMMLVVRMRRGLQPAGILASSSSPGLADNLLEMKSQGQTQGLADNIMDMTEADAQPKHFDPLDLLEGIAKSQNLREAEVNYGRVTMLATSEVEKLKGNMATVAAAAAVALVPTTAFAEVTFVEEAEGIFLGLFPYAAIVTIIFGGLIAKLGPALEKAQRLRRTLQLEYSAQKRFLKNTGDIRA